LFGVRKQVPNRRSQPDQAWLHVQAQRIRQQLHLVVCTRDPPFDRGTGLFQIICGRGLEQLQWLRRQAALRSRLLRLDRGELTLKVRVVDLAELAGAVVHVGR